MLRTLAEKLAPENAALFTIDIQNDFCNPEALPAKVYGRDVSMHVKMIDGIINLVDEARRCGVPVIHVLNEEPPWAMSEALEEMRLRRKLKRKAGLANDDYAICQPGTFGADFYRLKPDPKDVIVRKHRYSAFIGTDLDLILRSMNRKSIIFCGGATNMCLESTVRHAFMLDYYCVVIGDCAPTPWGTKAYQASLDNIELGFGEVIVAKEAVEIWKKIRDGRSSGPGAV